MSRENSKLPCLIHAAVALGFFVPDAGPRRDTPTAATQKPYQPVGSRRWPLVTSGVRVVVLSMGQAVAGAATLAVPDELLLCLALDGFEKPLLGWLVPGLPIVKILL